MEIPYYNISIKPYFSILINCFLYNYSFRHFVETCEPSLIPSNMIRAWDNKVLFFFHLRSDRPVHSLPPPRGPEPRARTLPVRLTRDDHHNCARPRTAPGFFFQNLFQLLFSVVCRKVKTYGMRALTVIQWSSKWAAVTPYRYCRYRRYRCAMTPARCVFDFPDDNVQLI